MKRERSFRISAATLAALLTLVILTACGSASPASGPAPSTSPAASPGSPQPSTAASSPATSASTEPAGAGEEVYQKAQVNWQQIVLAARSEKQPATFYSVNEQASLDRLEETFNKIDPKVQVKFMKMTGPVATERFKAEQATKQFIGNLYLGGSPSARSIAVQDLAQPIDDLPAMYDPSVKWISPPTLDKPRGTLTAGYLRYYILINTNALPTAEEPKTWRDLADPKWKDKLVLWDPRLGGTGQAIIATLYSNPDYGPDLVRKILANARMVQDPSDPRLIAKGDFTIGVCSYSNYLSVKDAPVKVISPTDGVIATPMQFVVSKNAPQLNTTKVFLNWILSKEGQNAVGYLYSALRTDADAATKDAQVGDAKLMKNVPASFEFETVEVREMVKTISKWLEEMGK